jgi:ribose-phosphate pyrophosphokinase
MDLHANQIQGFFDIPVDNLYAAPVLLKHILKNIGTKNIVCVAPDVGGVERARAIGKRLSAGLAIIDKRRERPGQSEVMNVIGEIENKSCIIIDDLIDSGGTICNAADALIEKGGKEVYCYVVHGVITGSCIDKIKKSKMKKIVITDTIDNTKKIKGVPKIEVVSISPLIAEAIKRISQSTSVSSLFK